jgi:hypothetical protein
MVKSPWLYVLERPARLLHRDFPRFWRALAAEREKTGCAVLVLDRSASGYPDGAFAATAGPGAAAGSGAAAEGGGG